MNKGIELKTPSTITETRYSDSELLVFVMATQVQQADRHVLLAETCSCRDKPSQGKMPMIQDANVSPPFPLQMKISPGVSLNAHG